MPAQRTNLIGSLLLLILAGGCSKQADAPEAMPVAESASKVQETFSKAQEEIRILSEAAAAAIQRKEFPSAYATLQALLNRPDLTPEQRSVAGRALVGVNGEIQKAVQRGDSDAAAFRQMQIMSK